MPLGVSKKTFLLFSPLLALTLLLGVSVYFGTRSLLSAEKKILAVKDFEVQLAEVEALAHDAFSHLEVADSDSFHRSLQEVLHVGQDLESSVIVSGRRLGEEIRDLPALVGFYRTAYEELHARQQEDEEFYWETALLLEALHRRGGGLPAGSREEYYETLGSVTTLHRRLFHDREFSVLRALKDILRDPRTLAGDDRSRKVLESIILKSEENHLSYLAMQNREEFLGDTAQTFSRITGEMVRALEAEVRAKQSTLARVVAGICAAAFLMALGLWFVVSRYVRKTLGGLSRAVAAVKAGDYGYDPPGLPKDEFGRLGDFIREMSLQLGRHIEQISRSGKFLQDVLDGVAEPIMLIGRDYQVRLMNRSAREIHGLQPGAQGSLTCHEVSHSSAEPCSGDDHPCPLRQILSTGEMITVQHTHCGKGGESRYVEIVASPLVGVDGGVEGIIEASRDITDRKRVENALRKANEDLDGQYRELKKVDRMKDGLIRDVSHELKTPVAKHAMQLEILKPIISRYELTRSEERAILVMEEGIRRQESVIRNLLDLSRLEEGGRGFRKKPMRLDELIERVREDNEYLFERCGGGMTVDVPAITIRSDEDMLWHLFSNLVGNAVKFRKKDSPLQVGISAEAGEGTVTVLVADDGEGLGAEELRRVFDRFYQSRASDEGSGVGLTICRKIVEGLEGSISLHSDGKGRGAVAIVVLPVE